MFKKKVRILFLNFGVGALLGMIFGIVILITIYFFKGGNEVLEQSWISYYFIDSVWKAETLLLLFGSVLLGICYSNGIILQKEISKKTLENQNLKKLNQTKTESTIFVTHQLRTPLAGLKFSLKMFLNGDFGKLSKEQETIVKKDLEGIEHLLTLVHNLLDISKIGIQQIEINKTFFDLSKFLNLIKDFIQEYIPLAKEKKIVFSYNFPQKAVTGYLKIDWGKIKQTLEILLENALNYTSSGGKIFLKVYLKAGFLVISISDTGIGIPLSEQKEVFTKFFRGSNAKRVRSRGTGFGLYLAKFFVKKHKGKIWFKSEEERGTTFYFTLPFKVEFEEFLKKI